MAARPRASALTGGLERTRHLEVCPIQYARVCKEGDACNAQEHPKPMKELFYEMTLDFLMVAIEGAHLREHYGFAAEIFNTGVGIDSGERLIRGSDSGGCDLKRAARKVVNSYPSQERKCKDKRNSYVSKGQWSQDSMHALSPFVRSNVRVVAR